MTAPMMAELYPYVNDPKVTKKTTTKLYLFAAAMLMGFFGRGGPGVPSSSKGLSWIFMADGGVE